MLVRGELEGAAQPFGAAEAHLEKMGIHQSPPDQVEADHYLAQVRDQLTAAELEAAWDQGRAMSLEEAFALASGEEMPA